ncbi:MAG: LamG domain-containing protein, partial [Bacteroidales bacterium]|nr:LamG domain-containing protein [Bacteroidales bacterium]
MKTITLIIATVVISCTGLTAQIAAQGGYALEFDGSNDYITFGSDPSLIITASVTIEAWVNLETTGQQCFVAGKIKHGNPQYGYGMYINNGNLGGDAGQVTFIAGRSWFDWPSVRSNARLNTNEWYHIVGTFDGRYLKLYVNGKLDNTYDYGSVYTINDSGDNFKIGYNSNLGSNYFSGKIDEVRVWNTARTEAQIKTNMYKELVGNEAGLMAYYKMNDGSGTSLTDNSTNSNTGTLTNGPEWKLSGCFGGSRQALDLDGVDDYVNLGNSFDLKPANALTFECWLNANDWNPTATHQVFAGNTQGGGYNFAIGYPTSNDVGFAVYSSGAYRRVDASIADFDGWHHIAGTFDGQYVKIYIDGILYDTENIGSSGNTITYDGDNSTILGEEAGALNIPAGYNFAGKIDEVRFWNTARTEAQIQENMMKTLAGNEAGLVAYYRMDQYDGTTLYDLTSNGLNGILYNMNVSDWVSSIAFNTWIGSDDNSWTNANNWSNGAPASGQSLGFYNSTNDVDFTLNSGLNYGSLFLSGVNSLNFDSNTDLSFDGNVINNGEISIFSNTSGDASLIIDGDITGSGIYNVERYL